MKKRLALCAFALLWYAGPAVAGPLTGLPSLPNDTPVYFQFNNLEQVDTNGGNDLTVPGTYLPVGNTQGNWGVFNVSSMQIGGVATQHLDISGGGGFFADDGTTDLFGQGQIHGLFYGINLTSATTATGGFMDIFYTDPSADVIDSNCLNGISCAPDATTVTKFTSGTFLARLAFASGIITGDNTTTIQSSSDPSVAGASGQADSFANIVIGATVGGDLGLWEQQLNGNWFFPDPLGDGTAGVVAADSEKRDIRFSNFFNLLAGTALNPLPWNDATTGAQGLRSNDPGRVFTADTVPEPATLVLFGFGLVGAAARRRKKA